MCLRSSSDHVVHVAALDLAISVTAGEEIRTEISAKFREDGIAGELDCAGFAVERWMTDAAGDFALSLSRRT